MPLKYLLEGAYWLYDFADRARMSRQSRSYLEHSQRQRFRRLVRFAQRHSPYYAALIKRLGIDPRNCQVQDFPVITKQEVATHFDQIVTDRHIRRQGLERFVEHSSDPTELYQDRFYVVHTSGSSGFVGYYVYTIREWIRGCSQQVRFLGRLALRRRMAFVGAAGGHYTGASLALTGTRPVNRLFFNCRAYDVNRPISEVVQELNAFQPRVLTGYGAALYVLALEQIAGRLQIRPDRIVNSGEPMLSGSRPFIEQAFQAPISNVYACSEHLFMGASRDQQSGLMLFEDDLIYELFDHHACVTNLFNRTMPLIRYRMDDALHAQAADATTSGSRGASPFTVVRDVVGRCERPIVLRNELGEDDFIHPLVMTELVARHLLAFQLRILDHTSFVLRAKLEPNLTAVQREACYHDMHQYLMRVLKSKRMDRSVRYQIEEVDGFQVDHKSGKFRLIETPDTYESLLHQRTNRAA